MKITMKFRIQSFAEQWLFLGISRHLFRSIASKAAEVTLIIANRTIALL
jgi:hypothetical protein